MKIGIPIILYEVSHKKNIIKTNNYYQKISSPVDTFLKSFAPFFPCLIYLTFHALDLPLLFLHQKTVR